MKMRIRALLLAAMFVVSLLPAMSFAEATVRPVGTEGELDDALTAAVAGDTIKLTADITVSGEKVVTKGIIIDGDGHKLTTNNRLKITAGTGVNVTVQNLKFVSEWNASGAHTIRVESGNVTLSNVEIDTCDEQHGGGIVVAGGDKVTLNSCKINAKDMGYAVYAYDTHVEINDSELTGLSAVTLVRDNGNVTVNNSVLTGVNPEGYEWTYGTIAVEAADCQVRINNSVINCVTTDGIQQRVFYEFDHSTKVETRYDTTTLTIADSEIVLDGAGASLFKADGDKGTLKVTATVQTKNGATVEDSDKTAFAGAGKVTDYVPPAYAGPVMNWVTVNTSEKGVVKSGPLAASAGATVTLYPKAATGYVLDTIEVLDAEGNAVELDGLKFQIPLGGVTVNATFKLAE